MVDVNKLLIKAFEFFTQKKFNSALENIEAIGSKIQEEDPVDQLRENKINDRVSIENFRGFIYLGLNQHYNAKECFEKSLNLKPDSSQACAGLGEVLYLQGKDLQAKSMFEWGIVNDGKNLFALEGLKKVNKLLDLDENDNSLTSNSKNG